MRRTPLCSVDYCPARTDPWWHVCQVCESPEIHHHHIEERGMGGSKSRKYDPANIIPLCALHHEQAHGIGASV